MNSSRDTFKFKNKPTCLFADYLPGDNFEMILADPTVLAAIGYDRITRRNPDDPRGFCLAMPPLGQPGGIEVWRAGTATELIENREVVLCRSGSWLFGSLIMEDDDHDSFPGLIEDAYTRLVSASSELGYPHLLRVWNCFPRINDDPDGLERYQQFCLGRHNALEKLRMDKSMLPAASAVGSCSAGLAIYFIASGEPGMQIENPKQVSAFHYPAQYAPKSPSFSRAMYHDRGEQFCFYISGTASISGHETRHEGDIEKQVRLSLCNINILIGQLAEPYRDCVSSINDLSLIKVYLRRERDESCVRKILEQECGGVALQILMADICRDDLLVEIEGVYLGKSPA